MAVLTIRDVSEETRAALRREADRAGRSLSRHVVAVLDQQAARERRRAELRELAGRLEAARARLGIGVDSGALLAADRR